ncbi:pentapeptide repeat-containing protein [Actinomadura sp. GTD37]|uniref:pentapeptide repeat-containing protein n=1 Tax=Actinomadura sp. GTD37 TaxID=1778030 RepID=UPI0035C01105
MTASSGTHDSGWGPRTWPLDAEAAATLRDWLSSPDSTLYALDLDFRGADLDGVDFTEAWLSGSVFSGSNLSRSLLWRAHCENTSFREADLSDAELVKSFLTEADFAGARMVGAKLGRAECIRTSFVGADMRRTDLGDASFIGCDMRNADLRESTATMAAFGETDLTNVKVTGMTGSVVGSIVLTTRAATTELAGVQLERWFNRNGADVAVEN